MARAPDGEGKVPAMHLPPGLDRVEGKPLQLDTNGPILACMAPALTDRQRLNLLKKARRRLENTTQGFVDFAKTGKGSEWRSALEALDALAADLELEKPATPNVPALGPVVKNGVSVLTHDLTHATDGVDNMPAFDEAVGSPGLAVIAPEGLTVTKIGRFVRRDGRPNGRSVYATGTSGINWVFGHVEGPPAVGATIRKGAEFCTISSNHEAPHLHCGIDARALTGGADLEHHTNYTHGAPTVGVQLAGLLS